MSTAPADWTGGPSASLLRRHRRGRLFRWLCTGAAAFSLLMLALLLAQVVHQGWPALTWHLLRSRPSLDPRKAGVLPALLGTLWTIGITTVVTVPLGIGAALYLEEFAPRNRWTKAIELNISNLAGVPSVIYGLLGLTVFARWCGLGRSLLAGGLTLSLLILPVVIIAAREAVRAVPQSLRQAALGVGATRWQAVYCHVLPAALPGILTGVILALSRAIGEAAPLILVGAAGFVTFLPRGPLDAYTVLPIQVFNWAKNPIAGFANLAGAGILVLLAVLLSLNALAVGIRQRAGRKLTW